MTVVQFDPAQVLLAARREGALFDLPSQMTAGMHTSVTVSCQGSLPFHVFLPAGFIGLSAGDTRIAVLQMENIADDCAISSRITALEMMVNKLLEQTHDSTSDMEKKLNTVIKTAKLQVRLLWVAPVLLLPLRVHRAYTYLRETSSTPLSPCELT